MPSEMSKWCVSVWYGIQQYAATHELKMAKPSYDTPWGCHVFDSNKVHSSSLWVVFFLRWLAVVSALAACVVP